MHGLPPDFDPGVLVGQTLEMICFAQADVYFHLGDKIIITVGSHLEYKGVIHEIPLKEAAFIEFIGSSVVKASTTNYGDLNLQFDNRGSLSILNSESHFESYSIKLGNRTVYV